MSDSNCRSRESHPLSGWIVAAGVLVFTGLAYTGQKESSGGRLVALGEDTGAWGDVTAGGAPYAAWMGCPVSTSVGEYYFTKPLMNLGGPLALEFSLHYASRIEKWMGAYNDPFGGDSFTHNYYIALRRDPNSVQVLYTEGNTIQFDKQGNTWQVTGEEVTYQLRETTGYYYLLDPLLGRVYTFQKAATMGGNVGVLVRIEDRNGNTLKFTNSQDSGYMHPTRIEDGLAAR